MQKEHQHLPFKLLLSTLHELCKMKKTGTMYISTDDNHAARFTLKNGEIVACGFSSKRGIEALELMRNINAGKYSFIESTLPAEPKQDILTTQEILDYLTQILDPSYTPPAAPSSNQTVEQSPTSVDHFPFSASAPTPAPPIQPPTQQTLVLDAEKRKVDIPKPDELMELLQEELALYIGPLGPAVCNMHAEKILQTYTSDELRAVIMALSKEVGSSDEAKKFQNGVWARLS
jgi:hypothetical protein